MKKQLTWLVWPGQPTHRSLVHLATWQFWSDTLGHYPVQTCKGPLYTTVAMLHDDLHEAELCIKSIELEAEIRAFCLQLAG